MPKTLVAHCAGMVGKHKFTIYTPTEHMVRYTKQNTGSLVGTRASSFSSTRKIPVVNAREMTEVRGGVQHEDDSEFLGAWETAEAESPDTPLGLGMTKTRSFPQTAH